MAKGRYVNPFTDFGFKRLFGSEPNKDLLIDFLNQLLPPQHKVKELTYARTEAIGDTRYDRGAVFDIYCVSPSGEHFIVEMQKAKQIYFKDRSLFYATWPIRDQAPRGENPWDYQLSAVYLIGILDFVMDDDKNSTDFCHYVQLKDQANRVFYDKLLLIYLEMPKFQKTEDELETTYDKWLYLLKHLPSLTERPAKLQEKIFSKVLEIAEVSNFTREELGDYENSLKHYRDSINVIETATIEGLAKGIAQGEAKKANEVVRKALLINISLSDIAQITGLSEAEIEVLQKEMTAEDKK